MRQLFVWWTSQQDCELIAEMFEGDNYGPPNWPSHIHSEFASRYGRNGRGRLWAPVGSDVEVAPWPDTPFAVLIGKFYGGIVIDEHDLSHVIALPGVITDLELHPLPVDVVFVP